MSEKPVTDNTIRHPDSMNQNNIRRQEKEPPSGRYGDAVSFDYSRYKPLEPIKLKTRPDSSSESAENSKVTPQGEEKKSRSAGESADSHSGNHSSGHRASAGRPSARHSRRKKSRSQIIRERRMRAHRKNAGKKKNAPTGAKPEYAKGAHAGQTEKESETASVVKEYGMGFASTMSDKRIGTFASSIAFFFFLSIIPLLILIAALVPKMGVSEHDLITAVTAVVPNVTEDFIERLVVEAYSKSNQILPVSLIILVWSSSSGMMAIIRGINAVYGTHEERNYLKLTLLSIFYTTLMLLLVIAVLVLMVFGRVIRQFFNEYFTVFQINAVGMTTGRLILLILSAVFLFLLMYTYLPSQHQKMLYQIPGAVFTTLAWGIFSFFFTLYVNGINRYTMFYGSVSTIAILMFWMYCCFYILLLGGHINVFFARQWRKLIDRKREESQELRESDHKQKR